VRNVQNWLVEGSRLELQWLQVPSEGNEDNVSAIRREANRHFRNKKREYLKDKINELESNRIRMNLRRDNNLELTW
jgi:uncharacterized protein (DUF2252 family)